MSQCIQIQNNFVPTLTSKAQTLNGMVTSE